MTNILKAEYLESKNPQFRGNPLIESLPEKKGYDDFYTLILNQKAISRKEALNYEKDIRIEFLTTFRLSFYVPQERLYHLYTSIYSSITAGYHLRNPSKTNVHKELRQSYHDLPYGITENENASSLSSCLFGFSGIGKTTAVNKILTLFPRAIAHNLPGIDPIVQVPFVKIECPKDSSRKDLCRSFFSQLDQILGTNYQFLYDKPRASADSMVNAMSKLAISHKIGVLIIDEIQQLTSVKTKNTELLLNFFVNFNNRLRIPILIVGTPESIELFSRSHRLPRRWSGEGAKKWRRLAMDSEWEFFIEMLFKHQFTESNVAFSKRWAELFYYHSIGILDRAIRIFTESQKVALSENHSAINEELVNNVVRDSFWLEEASIKAIRNGQNSDISKFPDLFFEDDRQQNSSTETVQKVKEGVAIDSLLEFGIPHEFFNDRIRQVLNNFPHYSAEKIALEIMQSYKNETILKKPQKKVYADTTPHNYLSNDLRKCDPSSGDFHKEMEEKGVMVNLVMEEILPLHGS